MSKLKPCPFCAGEAGLTKTTRHGNGGCDLFTWRIKCKRCGIMGPTHDDKAIRDDDGIRLIEDGRKILINKWNKRPNPWISVKDMLPKEKGYYIVGNYCNTGEEHFYSEHSFGFWDGSNWGYIKSQMQLDEITHWMPLPGPPQKESEKYHG